LLKIYVARELEQVRNTESAHTLHQGASSCRAHGSAERAPSAVLLPMMIYRLVASRFAFLIKEKQVH